MPGSNATAPPLGSSLASMKPSGKCLSCHAILLEQIHESTDPTLDDLDSREGLRQVWQSCTRTVWNDNNRTSSQAKESSTVEI
jgi:hypothetical protein